MAGITRGGQSLELSHCRAGMTRITVQRGMRADEREAVQVLIDLLDRNVPPLDRVALLAIGAHLALVNVGVTVRAVDAHIRENRLSVALRATYALMHAAQGILGGVVIEFRDGANWFPAAECVAVLAWNTQTSVRAPSIRGRLRLPTCQFPAREHRQGDHEMQQNCRSQGLPQPLHEKDFDTRRKP